VSEDISGVFDQAQKGLATSEAKLVVHMTPAFSEKHWDTSDDEVLSEIQKLIQPHCQADSKPGVQSLHRWRYCEPLKPVAFPFLKWGEGAQIWIAGDAFLASRVDGAFTSGESAAGSVIDYLEQRPGASSQRTRALKSAWLSELQAISIYEAEISILKKTAFTKKRKRTLELCERILSEELHHSESVKHHFKSDRLLAVQVQVSKWVGTGIGVFLSLLPSRTSWRVHAWAEREAAQIYSSTYKIARLPELTEAEAQERAHAQLFEEALQL
jgi:hypothetical protein